MSILAGITNHDSSFFEIKSPDIASEVLKTDIMSFSYTEELQRFGTGSLVLYDPDHFYSKVLRMGARLELSFGYKKEGAGFLSSALKKSNLLQAFGPEVRTGIRANIMNPAGNAGSNGVVTYSCNFYGRENLTEKQYRIHTGQTKGDLVGQILTELGVNKYFVSFTRQKELLDKNTQIIQRETNYKLLLKFAREWRAIFRVGYSADGKMTAVFVSPDKAGEPAVAQLMNGSTGGNSIFLEYKYGEANVIEYSWKNHAGDSGSGDNTRIVTGADGNPTFIRYVTKGDTTQAYRLNPDRIRRKMDKAPNFKDKYIQMKEWLNAEDFKTVKWAFDPITLKTAPQGLGYSLNAKMMGNPLASAPMTVFFGEGFPVWFKPEKPERHVSNYICRKVIHNFSGGAYTNDLEIMDTFTTFGGALI